MKTFLCSCEDREYENKCFIEWFVGYLGFRPSMHKKINKYEASTSHQRYAAGVDLALYLTISKFITEARDRELSSDLIYSSLDISFWVF